MDIQFIKILKRLLVFIIVSFFVYSILVCIWGYYLPVKYSKNLHYKLGSSYLRFQEAELYKNIDILFVGSSHAYRGFDTRIFEKAGYSSFNIGSTAQTPKQTKYLLEHYIDKFNPKILVMEVYPNVFMIDGVESTLDILSNNPDINGFNLVFEHTNPRVLNSFIYSEYVNAFQIGSNKSIPILSSIDEYIIGGFVEKKMIYNNFSKRVSLNKPFLEEQFVKFEEINAYLKEKKIRAIYVFAPIVKRDYNSFKKKKEFNARISKLGAYYDFNELLNLNDTLHFFDAHHLNQDGVKIFNKELIRLIDSIK